VKKDFYWTEKTAPHSERRKEILQKYPQVKELFGPDIRLAFVTVFLVILQLAIAYFIDELSFIWILIIAYIAGATITHILFLAIHEITHNMAFKKQTANNWLSFVANIPIVFPYAISFKLYHTMHHRQQGEDTYDVDIPTKNEAKFFSGVIGKMFWAFIQIIFYAFRPVFVRKIKITKWQVYNIVFQIIAISVFIYFAGWYALIYLLLSDFFAGSIHPLAGHFIAEHYVFKEGQETYSYYGPANKILLNVGYHNEHHDFPSIPGFRLPKLKAMAGEYYDNLYSHKSYLKVLFSFIFKRDISLFSRVKRTA
jgi:sphingolipid delta-4 desaturase